MENELLVERLESERDDLRRELIGLQEMLAFVLDSVGAPVEVSKKRMQERLPQGTRINIDDDIVNNKFIFSLDVANVEE